MDAGRKYTIYTSLEVASYIIDGGVAGGQFAGGTGDRRLVEFYGAYQAWGQRTLNLFGSDEPSARFWCAVELYSAFVERVRSDDLGREPCNIRLAMVMGWLNNKQSLQYEERRDGDGDVFRHMSVPAQTEYPEGFQA